MHACMHACMHAYIHTYIPTYIHACMHACMHACKEHHRTLRHTHGKTRDRVTPIRLGNRARYLDLRGRFSSHFTRTLLGKQTQPTCSSSSFVGIKFLVQEGLRQRDTKRHRIHAIPVMKCILLLRRTATKNDYPERVSRPYSPESAT